MGISPLPWQELRAWRLETKRELPWWAIPLLRELSEAYVSEYMQAKSPARPAPYMDQKAVDRQRVADGLKAMFRGMMAANGQAKKKRKPRKEAVAEG